MSLIINGGMMWGKQSLTPSPLLSSFRRLHEQRPMVPRRGRGVVSRGNGGSCLRVNKRWRCCWYLVVKWFASFHRVICRVLSHEMTQFIAWNDANYIMLFIIQRRRCCAFDSPGLPNDSAGYPGLAYGLCGTTPSVLRFFGAIYHIFWREIT